MEPDTNYVMVVDENNKLSMHKVVSGDFLYYFELNEWFAANAFRSFSVKLVLNGAINYKIGNTHYPVKKDQAFIGNKQPDVKSYFDSKEAVKSVCLNISMDTMAEAYAVMTSRKEINLDNMQSRHFTNPSLVEWVYTIAHNDFLSPLHSVALKLAKNKNEELHIDEEFFMGMGEKIILQLFETGRSYDNLDCIRAITKKEILRRLDIAKNYLEENYLDKPSVSEIARHCNMSEFHFFRSFRQAFDVTPYQLQLKLRLEQAKKLIAGSDISFTEIAAECSFPDLATFSKAYKRYYNVLPSLLRRESISRK